MAGVGLFGKAKKAPAKKSTKKEHQRLQPTSIDQEELFELITEYEKCEVEGKKVKARLDLTKSELKQIAVDTYLDEYKSTGSNPGTVMIEAKDGSDVAQFMFAPMDKYISVKTGEDADELIEKYGDVVDRNTTFSFDNKMLDKHMETISNLIENCDDIPEADKLKLFVQTETFNIKKGTLNKLNDIHKQEENEDGEFVPTDETYTINESFEALKPIVMLKTPQVIK